MGQWMKGEKPTIAEKIAFAHDASDYHLFWADAVVNDPQWIPYADMLGDQDWQEECAVLHEETAEELEELQLMEQKVVELERQLDELTKEKKGSNPGCISPFRRKK